MSDKDDGARLVWFLAGAALGAAGALLMAPQPGHETREQLRRRAEQGRGYVQDRGREAVDRSRELYQRGREIAEEAATQGRQAIEKGRERLKWQGSQAAGSGDDAATPGATPNVAETA
jgi:gas vesicle protein